MALEWGLSRADVERAHHTDLDGLICAALRDRVVSEAEQADLMVAAQLLGVAARTAR